jgi:N utilization substance protein B
MISRRAIRIRVFQFLFSYFKQNGSTPPQSLVKQCLQSLDKSYYFYLLVLSLLDDFRINEINDIENQKNKFIKTNTTITPVFTSHPFLIALSNSKEFYNALNQFKVNFKDKDWTLSVYKAFKKTDIYLNYIQNFNPSDKEKAFHFLEELLIEYLYNNEILEHFFEEESQFAQDDLYLAINVAHKTLEEFNKHNSFTLLPKFKDEISDKKFIEELINYTIQNYSNFDSYIAQNSENWDIERINFADLLLLKMCMSELIYFPEIPLKTSVDEYIEISKEYSTPQSYVFINGILAPIIKYLTEKGMIKKS